MKQPSYNTFLVGNNPLGVAFSLGKENSHVISKRQYREFEGEKFYGTYGVGPSAPPVLIVKDLDLIRSIVSKLTKNQTAKNLKVLIVCCIAVKDFDHFTDRTNGAGIPANFGRSETDEVWNHNLLSLRGQEWRDVRAAFTPIFTSGKMKMMMTFMNITSNEMTTTMARYADRGEDLELKKLCGSFSMETIASCVFGVKADSFNPSSESQFLKHAESVFTTDMYEAVLGVLYLTPLKALLNALKIPLFRPVETRFFMNIVKDTIRHRRETGERRNDLVDLMIDALRKDLAQDSSEDEESAAKAKSAQGSPYLNEDTIVATALVLLTAGYDTTGNTLSYFLLELAKNQDIQEKLRAEVDEAYETGTDKEGRLTYGTVQGLPYLELVLYETLRKYPAAGTGIIRECIKDYTLPGTNVTIKKGQEVNVSTIGVHFDDKYYPNPEKFDPERFTKEAKSARHPMAFLTFGQGPRACIGSRFALAEMKVAVAKIVREFYLKPCANTPEKIDILPESFTLTPKTPLLIQVERRDL